MNSLLSIVFAYPWYLTALAVLPVLWFLLRLVPPAPKRVRLPHFFLLDGVQQDKKVAATTPLWLIILRLLMAGFAILAFARPLMTDDQPGFDPGGTTVVIVDNGWASAYNWQDRMDRMVSALKPIEAAGGKVILLPSAARPEDAKVAASDPLDAAEAAPLLQKLAPRAWSVDHIQVGKEFDRLRGAFAVTGVMYFSEGVNATGTDGFVTRLADIPAVIYHDQRFNNPPLLREEGRDKDGSITLQMQYLHPVTQGMSYDILARGQDGEVLDRTSLAVASGEQEGKLALRLTSDMRQKLFRLDVAGFPTAATAVLQDTRARRGLVGILSSGQAQTPNHFLDENYYIQKAFETSGAAVVQGNFDVLMNQGVSVVAWADHVSLTAQERDALTDWLNRGGLLLRFAGPALAANPQDALLPLRLRAGQRALQGAMTWEKPQALGAPPENTPFYGTDMPTDVRVNRQVLAEATPDVLSKTWLQLEDGTPLVTAAPFGDGRVVLVHTTAGPSWSDFCYSRLFVALLDLTQDLAQTVSQGGAMVFALKGSYAPVSLLDGFGNLQTVPKDYPVQSIDAEKDFFPGPETPPGLYAHDQYIIARNLGDRVAAVTPIALPKELTVKSYDAALTRDYTGMLFSWLVLLFLVETIATFFLRGLFGVRKSAVAAFIAVSLFHPAAVFAETADAASSIYLAYVETGNAAVDGVSHRGLQGLMQVINSRTSIKIEGVVGVNPAQDELYFYPLLYWPLTASQPPLSATAAERLTQYMDDGGTVFLDTRDGQFQHGADGLLSGPGGRRLQSLAQEIPIPELMPIERGHILAKSFYLLETFPGSYEGGQVWVEKEPKLDHDAISSVVIGENDWAAAWTQDESDRRRFSLAGGDRQREFAYRFGVNLAMMVLAGNYKSDQLHVSHILKRMQP